MSNSTDKISLHRRRAEFGDAPDREGAARQRQVSLASLSFVAEFASQPPKVTVDLSGFPEPSMARQIIQILWESTRPGAGTIKSGTSLDAVVQSIRSFGIFLRRVNEDADRPSKVTSLRDITGMLLDEYDKDLASQGQAESTRYNKLKDLRAVLQLAKERGLTAPDLEMRLKFVSTSGRPKPSPKDEYDAYVTAQVLDAARRDIDGAVQRITVYGQKMLQEGHTPDNEQYGYESASNILVGVKAGAIPVARPQGQSPLAMALLPNRTDNYRADNLRIAANFCSVLSFLFPVAEDIFAFQALLCLETGLPPTSIRWLKIDCLSNEKRGFADLHYIKKRSGVDTALTKRISLDGKHSPGAAIKKFLVISRNARELAPEPDRNYLFVGCALGNNAVPFGCRHLDLTQAATKQARSFVARHGIKQTNTQPLVDLALDRLKKTHTTDRYRKMGGNLIDTVLRDKRPTTAAQNYLNVPGTKDLHEQAVVQGLQGALHAATEPKVLTAEIERRIQRAPDEVASGLGISRKQVDEITKEANDVWFASCLGYHDSPYGEHGKACPTPIWGCLECANAVIGSSKLPAILAFLNHILERRQQMNLAAWESRYGRAHVRIVHQILPRFPAPEIADAKAIAAAEADLVWLSAELTHT